MCVCVLVLRCLNKFFTCMCAVLACMCVCVCNSCHVTARAKHFALFLPKQLL